MTAKTSFWAAFFACLSLFAFAASSEPAVDVSTAQREFSAPLQYTDGFCLAVTGTAVNAFASGTRPARLTTTWLGEMRFVKLKHADATDADKRVCASVGGSPLGENNVCDLSTDTADPLLQFGDVSTYLLQRTRQAGSTTGALPELWLVAEAGSTVTVCLTVGG